MSRVLSNIEVYGKGLSWHLRLIIGYTKYGILFDNCLILWRSLTFSTFCCQCKCCWISASKLNAIVNCIWLFDLRFNNFNKVELQCIHLEASCICLAKNLSQNISTIELRSIINVYCYLWKMTHVRRSFNSPKMFRVLNAYIYMIIATLIYAPPSCWYI